MDPVDCCWYSSILRRSHHYPLPDSTAWENLDSTLSQVDVPVWSLHSGSLSLPLGLRLAVTSPGLRIALLVLFESCSSMRLVVLAHCYYAYLDASGITRRRRTSFNNLSPSRLFACCFPDSVATIANPSLNSNSNKNKNSNSNKSRINDSSSVHYQCCSYYHHPRNEGSHLLLDSGD
jgi:hypothetical protein